MLGKVSAPFRELEKNDGVLLITKGGLFYRREDFREVVEQGWGVRTGGYDVGSRNNVRSWLRAINIGPVCVQKGGARSVYR